MRMPGFRYFVRFGLLGVAGCAACAGRTVPPQRAAPLPTATERAVVLRDAWQTVLRERAEREARIATVQEEDAAQDVLARMPRVSFASGGTATLAEATHLLLSGTGYSCEYESGVDPRQPVATYIAHQRLDDALASVVRPLGYTVEVAPLQRRLRIAPLQTRTWRVADAPRDDSWNGQSTYGIYRVDYSDSLQYYRHKCYQGKRWACMRLDSFRHHYYSPKRYYYYSPKRHYYYYSPGTHRHWNPSTRSYLWY